MSYIRGDKEVTSMLNDIVSYIRGEVNSLRNDIEDTRNYIDSMPEAQPPVDQEKLVELVNYLDNELKRLRHQQLSADESINRRLNVITQDMANNINERFERLEKLVLTRKDEEASDRVELPYKARLARSLANGDEDMLADLETVLRTLPEDNVRVLMGYVVNSVDALRSTDQFRV